MTRAALSLAHAVAVATVAALASLALGLACLAFSVGAPMALALIIGRI